jgi:hypothetical protein
MRRCSAATTVVCLCLPLFTLAAWAQDGQLQTPPHDLGERARLRHRQRADYRDATLRVKVKVRNAERRNDALTIEAKLLDVARRPVFRALTAKANIQSQSETALDFEQKVSNPLKWSAATTVAARGRTPNTNCPHNPINMGFDLSRCALGRAGDEGASIQSVRAISLCALAHSREIEDSREDAKNRRGNFC